MVPSAATSDSALGVLPFGALGFIRLLSTGLLKAVPTSTSKATNHGIRIWYEFGP
jgi:hypothetical protein